MKNKTLSELKVRGRLRTLAKKHGWKDLKDLANESEVSLLCRKGLGRKTVVVIRELLIEHGGDVRPSQPGDLRPTY